jgi:hypothetical protein
VGVKADVLMERPISAQEAVRIAAEFAGMGLVADVRVALPRRSFEGIAVAVLAALPVQAFLSQLGE